MISRLGVDFTIISSTIAKDSSLKIDHQPYETSFKWLKLGLLKLVSSGERVRVCRVQTTTPGPVLLTLSPRLENRLMYRTLLSVMMFVVGLVVPAVAQQSPHFHVFVDPVNQSVNTLDVDWLIDHGQILMSTAIRQAPLMEFSWEGEDGTHHQLRTEPQSGNTWFVETTAQVGVESFEAGKIMPQGQGPNAPLPGMMSSWVDVGGTTHTVNTPTPSQTPDGMRKAREIHIQSVQEMQRAFPPRPVTPPPEPEPEEAFLSDPPRWHRPEAQLELVDKWA